jgi:hypothetical protein
MKRPTLGEFMARGIAAQKAVDAEIAAAAAPSEHPFIAVGPKVLRNGELIAGAKSATFARRIANALNLYKPDSRGQ